MRKALKNKRPQNEYKWQLCEDAARRCVYVFLVRAKVGNDYFNALASKRFSIRPQELTNDTLSVPKMFAHAQLPPTVSCCAACRCCFCCCCRCCCRCCFRGRQVLTIILCQLATLSIYVHCWRFGIFPLAKFAHFRHCCCCCCCSYSCLANSHCFVGLPRVCFSFSCCLCYFCRRFASL